MQPLDLALQANYVLLMHCVAGVGFVELFLVVPNLLMQHLQSFRYKVRHGILSCTCELQCQQNVQDGKCKAHDM